LNFDYNCTKGEIFYMSEHQIFVTVNGESRTPQDWSEYLGISIASFFMRLQDGRNVDDKLFGGNASTTVPTLQETVKNGRKMFLLTLKGQTKSLKEWCDEIGIGMTSLRYRLQQGYTEEQILQPRQATNSKNLQIGDAKLPVARTTTQKSEKAPSPSPLSTQVPKEVAKATESKKPARKQKKVGNTVTLLGTQLPIKEWSDTLGLSVQALDYRIKQGWSEQEILNGKRQVSTEPVVTKNPKKLKPSPIQRESKMDQEVCYEGEIKTLREWSVELNISQNVIRNRMNSGKKGRELLMPVKEVEARVGVRIGNRELSFRQWSEISGVPEDVIRSRYSNGVRGQQLIFLDPKYRKQA